jgi:hypothetical protein
MMGRSIFAVIDPCHRKVEAQGTYKESTMSTDQLHAPNSSAESPRPARALWIAAGMTALIGAFFLLREHWGHVAGYWPYLLLLACPVMHLFHGHGGHGHHGHHDAGTARSTNRDA